ncbi:MAG TPA: TolC family protein [Bryobacteraceae bacterium]|nr:TolC family protein [Bryobacteraceae bacterium]
MLRIATEVHFSIGIGLLFAANLAGQSYSSLQGSVPGAATPAPLALKLEDAIQRGLKFNLDLLESDSASQTARAERVEALSALLPQVTGTLMEADEQLNLRTLGFNVPPNPYLKIPTIVGPFSYTEAQANVSAKILDFNARRQLRSARANEQAAKLSVEASRDLVVQAVANAYLGVIADASRVDSIHAQVDTDQALYKRTADQKTAGVAAGIDVLRAQVQLKIEQQALLAQRNQFEKDKLALGRIIGLAPAQVFQLADTAPFAPLSGITQEEALRTALAQRPDYRSAKKMVEAAQHAVAAAQAEWYPTVELSGYYGDAGPTLTNSHGVYTVNGSLNFNIFTGGRIRADIEKARAALKDRTDELANQGAQIEVEVRNAFLDLQSSSDQVTVARDNLVLANQTLDQSRDRFISGVTDNIEVVQAQGSVAIANDNLIAALYAHNLAKVELAKAIGLAEQGVKKFIEVK